MTTMTSWSMTQRAKIKTCKRETGLKRMKISKNINVLKDSTHTR